MESQLCGECGKEYDEHLVLQLTSLGNCIDYVVPSFPVHQAKLRHVQYKFTGKDDNTVVYDGFVRSDSSANLKADSRLRLCSGYTYAFIVAAEEFGRCVDVSGLTLMEEKVFVIWKWNVCDDLEYVSETDMSTSGDESAEAGQSRSDDEEQACLNSVVFKCIGTCKEENYQQVLARAAALKKQNKAVETRILPEPQNPMDSKAIAFQVLIDDKWQRIGYMVKEVLDAVHKELSNDSLTAVELDWVKFITHWCRSTPGWYCGIKVTKKGAWDINVVRCRSTL